MRGRAERHGHGQLAKLYPRYGMQLRPQQIWQRLGATVMIGQNNVQGENFTVADAQGLVGFAAANGLGRLSMWSLNRDSQCGSLVPRDRAALQHLQRDGRSAASSSRSIFSQLAGSARGRLLPRQGAAAAPNTNPADAPYPLWSPAPSYPAGYKVVEGGEIYQAKWYNSGDDPPARSSTHTRRRGS